MTDPIITIVALLVAGYLLMALELFFIPGFGVTGILGLICLAAGCLYAFHFFGSAYGTMAVVLVLGSTTAVMLWIPKTRFGKDVVLSSSLHEACSAETELEMGHLGVAESDLRPAGIASFGELRRGVVTEGEFIDAGSSVVVTEVRGSRIVVELASSSREEEPKRA